MSRGDSILAALYALAPRVLSKKRPLRAEIKKRSFRRICRWLLNVTAVIATNKLGSSPNQRVYQGRKGFTAYLFVSVCF